MERHAQIQELLTGYAVGDLTPAEEQEVRTHLADCPACAEEARELTLAFQSVGLTEEPVAPPPALRARVLESLSASRDDARTTPPVVPIRRDVTPAARDRAPVSAARGGWSAAWLAAAAALVLVLGGLLAINQQRTAGLEQDLRRVEADVARLRSTIAETEAQADLAVSILTAGDMRRIDLDGVQSSRAATARAYWSASQGLLIVADRLPAPPPGRTYQVWLIGSESPGPVSAGLINSESSGRGMLIVPAPEGVRGGTVTVAVTDEPEGGLPAPTGGQHLVGSL